jgi:hypothetical protein
MREKEIKRERERERERDRAYKLIGDASPPT